MTMTLQPFAWDKLASSVYRLVNRMRLYSDCWSRTGACVLLYAEWGQEVERQNSGLGKERGVGFPQVDKDHGGEKSGSLHAVIKRQSLASTSA